MDPYLVDLARRLTAGDVTARAELTTHPGEMARALDEVLTSLERRTALLAETEQYFRALTEQSLLGICVLARDRVLFANDALATMVGYSVDEILGLADPLDIVHPEDRPTVIRNLERRFRGETFRAAFACCAGRRHVPSRRRRVLRRRVIGSPCGSMRPGEQP
jgi:PAS domain S-box-containing protein